MALNDSPEPQRDETLRRARKRRARAARRFRPDSVDILLVAEAPPSAIDRYFYFEDVREQDSLFRYVCRVALGRKPTRAGKSKLLAELREQGLFLIDLSPDPLDGDPLAKFVPDLVRRCVKLRPRAIILVKMTVHDAAYEALRDAALPVVDERVPFPGSGQQNRFVEAFARALQRAEELRAA